MSKKRILLIDDEPSFTHALKLNLEETGAYEVRAENRGTEGLAAARQFNPELILLDVVMPDMSGGEVASQIEADPNVKNTPIVFLSAAAKKEEGSAVRRLKRPASWIQNVIAGRALIAKPVTVEEVIDCIRKNLGK